MKVRELIEILKRYDDDLNVEIIFTTQNYWGEYEEYKESVNEHQIIQDGKTLFIDIR